MNLVTILRHYTALAIMVFCPYCFTLAQVQNFEEDFTIADHPENFLPGWSANEVRATASRVFQANQEGRNGSRALAVQPISSFSGLIYTQVRPTDFNEPKIAFFAKTNRNGSGTRPATVHLHYSNSGWEEFPIKVQVGNEESFPNLDTEYQLYEIPVPSTYLNDEILFLKIEVGLGPGTGSAARFFMDDFGIYDGVAVVDPVRIKKGYLLDPYTISLHIDKPIVTPEKNQLKLEGLGPFEISFPTDTLLFVQFQEMLPQNSISILIENLQDQNGMITPNTSFVIENTEIKTGQMWMISANQLLLSFSHEFEPASVSRTSNFKLSNSQPESIDLLENGFQAILNFGQDFELGQQLVLEAFDIMGKGKEETKEYQESSFFYTDLLESVFLGEQDLIEIFSTIPLDLNSFSIDSIIVEDHPEIKFSDSGMTPMQLKLRTNQIFDEGPTYTIQFPARLSSRGLPIHASKREVFWDRTPPEIVKVEVVEAQKIVVIFSEPLDPVYALLASLYSVNGTTPGELLLQRNDSQVVLTFPFEIEIGQTYLLEIEKLSDLSGNFGENYQFEFVLEGDELLYFRSIVLNELMPAPRPDNPLPNVEYVELYNPGDRSIYLGGMQLSNSRRETVLPSAVLGPKEYIILCPRTRVSEFERFGEVLGLTNWPTLLNTADQVKLKDSQGKVLDSLNYTSTTFGNTEIARGGYSLEVVNPYLECYLPSNLKVSDSEQRGTPGKQNSVYEAIPDLSPPRFEKSILIGEKQVILQFNKVLNQNLATISWNFSPKLKLKNAVIGSSPDQILLEFEEELKEGIKYLVEIKNLRDCSGNLFVQDSEVWIARPSKEEEGDIVINEVLFNARVQAPKFVEIYNLSDKFINLKDWKLANFNSDEEIANRRILFHEDFILEPHSFLVFTTNKAKLHQEYPKGDPSRFIEYSSLPSYPISSGNVVFMNGDESLIEIFSYHERMHHPLLRERRGVSLERLSPSAPVDDPNNWQSASSSSGFASPGRKNSQVFRGQEEKGIAVQPKVFNPESPGQDAFVTISYKMETPGRTASMRIYGINGILIREICQNAIWGREGFYLWDGTDMNGRKVRPGQYIIWIEIFELDGSIHGFKETVVVGTNF